MSWLSWAEMGFFFGSKKAESSEKAAPLELLVGSWRKPRHCWVIWKSNDTKMSCFTFLKVMMVLFNLFIVLGGGTLLGIGIWVAVDSSSFLKLFGTASTALQFVNVGYVLIALGAILFVLGFLGCCGAQKESKCLLITFFSIILIIFIIEVAAAVVALVYTSLAETILKGSLSKVLTDEYGTKPEVTNLWNSTMTEMKCCGLFNYTDFNGTKYIAENPDKFPPACCKGQLYCTADMAKSEKVEGCFPKLLKEIRKNASLVGGIAAGICALEIAAMAVAMYLYCHLDEK